jgi:hypothetical protein
MEQQLGPIINSGIGMGVSLRDTIPDLVQCPFNAPSTSILYSLQAQKMTLVTKTTFWGCLTAGKNVVPFHGMS